MSSESGQGSSVVGEGQAAAPVPDTTPYGADATTSGSRMMMQHPWLVAAAVAVYATKVMWVKFRALGLANHMGRLQKQRVRKSDPWQDDEENDFGSEAETDADCEEGDSDEITDNVELGLQLSVNRDGTEVPDNDRLVNVPPANFSNGICS